MKWKFFYKIALLFLIIIITSMGYGNNACADTKKYCEELLESATQEYLARNYVKASEILTKMQSIVKENGFVALEMSALNVLGLIYLDLLAYDKAMENFLKIQQLALKSHDLPAESVAMGNIAMIFTQNNEYDKALDYYKKAYDISSKSRDSIKVAEIAINIAYIANLIRDTTLAQQYINIAKNIPNDDKRFLIYAQTVTVELLLSKKDYSRAESIALPLLEEEIEPRQKIWLFFLLSKIYQHQGDFEMAAQSIYEILKEKPTLREKIKSYEQLSELYREENLFILALQYKDSASQAKDSLHNINNKQYVEKTRIQIELLNSEKQLVKNRAKQKTERILFISIISIIVILSMVLIWTLRNQSIRNKQRKQITELELEQEKNQNLIMKQQFKEQEILNLLNQEQLNNDNLRLERLLKEQETVALLEQERLNNEIDVKNGQLTARILSQSNKNQLIEEILELLPDTSGKQIDANMLPLVCRKLKTELKKGSELDSFLVHFEQINPKLFSFLKKSHPSLTINDIHLLSYIYLHLNTKEIASLLNITPDYCKKRKQRLAHKMGIRSAELYDYLVSVT